MVVLAILIFLTVFTAAVGGCLLLSSAGGKTRELKRRLSLLELRGIEQAPMPEVLKTELLSDVPFLQRILSRIGVACRMDVLLRQAGMEMKVGVFVLLSLAFFALGLLSGTILHWHPLFSFGIGAILSLVPFQVVRARGNRRRKAFASQFPDALEMFARSLRAGHSFTGAIQLVSQEMPDPVASEFRQVFDEQNLGVPLREALVGMTGRIHSLDAKFFVTAVLIQKETGGNLAEIVDKIAHVIRERFRIQGQLKIFTAQARMTGILLAVLPLAIAVAIGILSPDYLKPLWFEKMGRSMVVLACVLQLSGALVIRKILKIKI